jgi:hypothetical protein
VLFLWGAHPWEPEVIILEAAAAASEAAGRMMAFWADRERDGVPRLPVDGETLMRELGLESGPLLGRVLVEARLAWEAGEVASRAEVLAVARTALDRG